MQIRAWGRWPSQTDDLEEQMRCLKAIVALDPDLDHARVVPMAEGGSGEDAHLVVIASVGKAVEVQKEKYICSICGFALTGLGECPRCEM